MIKVLVKKLNPKAELPKYKTEGSSGMDLMASIEKPIIAVLPAGFVRVDTVSPKYSAAVPPDAAAPSL